MEKNKNIKEVSIALFMLFTIIFEISCMIKTNILKKELEDYKYWQNIQINSLWENVQQMQDEYARIIDILYNPNNPNYLGL